MPWMPSLGWSCRVIRACGWAAVLFATQAWAGAAVLDVAKVHEAPASLTSYFEVLDDASAALTLSDVTRPDRAAQFKPSQSVGEALSFSYTRSAIWLRLPLKNSSDQAVERVLEISYALLAHVDIHQALSAGGYQTTESGYARPLTARPHKSRHFVFPLTVPARSSQWLYLRVETPNSLNIPAKLWEPRAFRAYEREDYAIQFVYVGIVLAIGLYNLMLFLALRDTGFLLYLVFAANVAVAVAAFTGLGPEYLWGDNALLSRVGVNVASAVASIACLLFLRHILHTPAVVPRLDRGMSAFIALNATFVVLLLAWFREAAPFFIVLNAVTALFLLSIGLVCAYRRQRSAYYFVFAFSAILVAVVLSHLRNLGVLPTNFYTTQLTQLGSALEMLLLSFALADRYTAMRRERMRAQEEALQAQGALVTSLQASEQVLELRVAERTAELQAANQKLEALSMTDGLTGIANRRQFDAALAREWARAARLGQTLSLGLLDVDWFKLYNDHYGHQAGDLCLQRIARVLSETMGRTGDLVARYGGEEFVFIAPDTPGEGALQMADKVCQALVSLSIVHEKSALGVVSASIGVASLRPHEDQPALELLKAADAALYLAKARGRNQVVLSDAF